MNKTGTTKFKSAFKHRTDAMEQLQIIAGIPKKINNEQMLNFTVTEIPQPNLLGRNAIEWLQIFIDDKVKITSLPRGVPHQYCED